MGHTRQTPYRFGLSPLNHHDLLSSFEKGRYPVQKFALYSIVMQFPEDDVVVTLVKGLTVIEVDRIDCLVVLEEEEDRFIIFD